MSDAASAAPAAAPTSTPTPAQPVPSAAAPAAPAKQGASGREVAVNDSTRPKPKAEAKPEAKPEPKERDGGDESSGSDDAQPKADAKPAAKPAGEKRRFDLERYGDELVELQVSGRKVEVPLKEAIRLQQLERASKVAMQEAAERAKRAEAAMLERIKTDPVKVLGEIGPEAMKSTLLQLVKANDPIARDAVEQAFSELNRELQMSPEERLERERQAVIEERRAIEREREEARVKATAAEYQPVIERALHQALEAEGVAATPDTIGAMVELAGLALEQGRPLTQQLVQAIAMRVAEAEEQRRERYLGGLSEMPVDQLGKYTLPRLRAMPPEELARFLGEEKLREVREWDIARVRGEREQKRAEREAQAAETDRDDAPPRKPPQKAQRPPTPDEIREQLRARRARAGA